MKIYALLALGLILAGCTISPDRAKPLQDYPDATTPAPLPENNGGIIDDITIVGRGYNVVTPALAAKVEKWQGNQTGFVLVDYKSHTDYFPDADGVPAGYFKLWAVDKGTMFLYDTHGW